MAGTRTQNAKRNIYASLLNKMIAMLLPFVTRSVIIYTVGVLYLGLNGLFTSVLSVLSLAELGDVSREMKQDMRKRVFGLAIYKVSRVMRYSLLYTGSCRSSALWWSWQSVS